jgi:hypothetical protein
MRLKCVKVSYNLDFTLKSIYLCGKKNNLAYFLSYKAYTIETMTSNWKLRILLLVLASVFAYPSFAQWGDEDDMGWGEEEEATDSTDSDTLFGDDDNSEWVGFGDDGDDNEIKAYKFKRPEYVRVVLPYDSIRELIYYTEIMEVEECEECMADSLYWRSMHYLTKLYGKKSMKKFLDEDKKLQKIVLKVKVPVFVRNNKFAKVRNGDCEYKLILRFQDYRYKYDISNFVHLTPPQGTQKDVQRTYLEYYMKSKANVQNTDKILTAVDTDIQSFIGELKDALKDPPFLGIDLDNDW